MEVGGAPPDSGNGDHSSVDVAALAMEIADLEDNLETVSRSENRYFVRSMIGLLPLTMVALIMLAAGGPESFVAGLAVVVFEVVHFRRWFQAEREAAGLTIALERARSQFEALKGEAPPAIEPARDPPGPASP